jgi:hypothetical protein
MHGLAPVGLLAYPLPFWHQQVSYSWQPLQYILYSILSCTGGAVARDDRCQPGQATVRCM